MSGPHFRDYHLLLDEQATQIFATIDPLAERSRKLGQTTLRSIGHIARLARIADNDSEFVSPANMLSELVNDNKEFTSNLRVAHEIAAEREDVATTSILEVYIDESERRTWFLFEASRAPTAAATRSRWFWIELIQNHERDSILRVSARDAGGKPAAIPHAACAGAFFDEERPAQRWPFVLPPRRPLA